MLLALSSLFDPGPGVPAGDLSLCGQAAPVGGAWGAHWLLRYGVVPTAQYLVLMFDAKNPLPNEEPVELTDR